MPPNAIYGGVPAKPLRCRIASERLTRPNSDNPNLDYYSDIR